MALIIPFTGLSSRGAASDDDAKTADRAALAAI